MVAVVVVVLKVKVEGMMKSVNLDENLAKILDLVWQ